MRASSAKLSQKTHKSAEHKSKQDKEMLAIPTVITTKYRRNASANRRNASTRRKSTSAKQNHKEEKMQNLRVRSIDLFHFVPSLSGEIGKHVILRG